MNCKLIGTNVQHIELELMPGESFCAERGALIYMEGGITKEMITTGGGGLRGLIGSAMGGESMFQVRYTNTTHMPRRMCLGSKSAILPVKIQNETILCHKGAYIASSNQVRVTTKMSISGFTGGMGLFMQKITGDATVFLDSIGQPITKEIGYGEVVEADEDHIIALQGITEAQLSSAWSLKNMFSGEGLSMMKIMGPGKLYMSPGNLNIFEMQRAK